MNIYTYAPYGSEGIIIRVEADIRRGIPGIDITGLAEGAVREARERVRAAFRNSGFPFPADRILINLAPAGVKKVGAALDLPIALAVMSAAGLIPQTSCPEIMVLGELELSGRLRAVRGVLAAAAAGLKAGIQAFIIPADNAREAFILHSGAYAPASTLAEAVHALVIREKTGSFPPQERTTEDPTKKGKPSEAFSNIGDFRDVKGQNRYKRALEIAAAGGHNLMVFGPPGAGKTMLARRLPTIMAPLNSFEAVETARIRSLAGLTEEIGAVYPPFRAPHHSASMEGILGGGKTVRPGEISLANFGVLFLDEAPEFRSNLLQALREPLEDKVITISRAEGAVQLPADFQLILAANACPCGRLGSERRDSEETFTGSPEREAYGSYSGFCFCTDDEIHRYWRKFSGALLDRVELRVAVKAPTPDKIAENKETPSVEIAERVLNAVKIQENRFKNSGIRRNARIPPGSIASLCPLNAEAARVFRLALDKLRLSGRAAHGILKTARTIADLEGAEIIAPAHILEAVEHRRLGEDPYDVLGV